MNFIRRTIYLGYYLKKMNWPLLGKFLKYTQEKTGRSKLSICMDAIRSVYVYNVSILEYFQFRFFELDSKGRREWAGTGYMYEFQKKMNPPDTRRILDDKRLFHKKYGEFIRHKAFSRAELEDTPELLEGLYANEKLVLKSYNGKGGSGTFFMNIKEFEKRDLVEYMKDHDFDLVETYIVQHEDMNSLSPSGVNTVRIFTQLDNNSEVHLLCCRQRISVNSPVDNLAAGNIAASVDCDTGKINGPGVYSDVTKEGVLVHPVTNVTLIGFQIPYWQECVSLAKQAALAHPENRSIGWDIVVTPDGPGLIEGNHDWCKLVWQLPVKKGMKKELEKYV